jgi:hypothetical protein
MEVDTNFIFLRIGITLSIIGFEKHASSRGNEKQQHSFIVRILLIDPQLSGEREGFGNSLGQ